MNLDHTRNLANNGDLTQLSKDEQIRFKDKHQAKEGMSTFAEYYPGIYSPVRLENAQYLMAL